MLFFDFACKNITFPETYWKKYYPTLCSFIRLGKYAILENEDVFKNEDVFEALKEYRTRYKNKEYFTNPRFDKVGITTLFTFYWEKTIDTINFAKKLCKSEKDVMVGGIMSSLLSDEVYNATGIRPFVGLLNHPGDIDEGNELIIDELPLDYSILEETDYVYPANNAYFAYMTRGCVNKCKFCAVPKLEPKYCDYINLKSRIEFTKKRFGEQRDLLLLDNNVLASNCYDQIIDEIKDCGFSVGATYTSPNEYEITINNLKDSYNDRAYIRKAVKLYKEIIEKLKDDTEKTELYMKLEEQYCLNYLSSKNTYGYRRIELALRSKGYVINHKTVLKLMKSLNIQGKQRKSKYKSYKGEVGKVAPNILQRNFYTETPYTKLTTDVTEFNVCNEKVYLSPVLDMYNNEILSYSISLSPNFWQTREMLNNLFERLPKSSKPLLHSDQGWQYQMREYQALLKEHNITQSMSRKGNCLDNSVMENFFGRLKVEMYYGEKFESVNAFIEKLKEFIHYYNNERISLKLKGMSPIQYRTHYHSI